MIEKEFQVRKSVGSGAWSARSLATLIGVPHTTVSQWVKLDMVEARKGLGKLGHQIELRGFLQALTIQHLRNEELSIDQIRKVISNVQDLTREVEWEQLTFLVVLPKADECDVFVELANEAELMTSVLRYPGKRFTLFQVGAEARQKLAGNGIGHSLHCNAFDEVSGGRNAALVPI